MDKKDFILRVETLEDANKEANGGFDDVMEDYSLSISAWGPGIA